MADRTRSALWHAFSVLLIVGVGCGDSGLSAGAADADGAPGMPSAVDDGQQPGAGPLSAGAGPGPSAAGAPGPMASESAGAPEEPADGDSASLAVDLPRCVAKDSQVVLLGDSYVNYGSHTLSADLAAESGQQWRMYALLGASMASGGISFIPPQLDQALAADPDIRVVVMDGGGNDILVPDAFMLGSGDCKHSPDSANLPVCQEIVDKALDGALQLMDRIADAGVRDVVYFFYPHVPEGTFLGGANPNVILDYALPQVREVCEGAIDRTAGRLRCHFVDMVPEFAGDPSLFAAGDIHPNPAGSAVMAKAIWSAMSDACVGQDEASGCCAP